MGNSRALCLCINELKNNNSEITEYYRNDN